MKRIVIITLTLLAAQLGITLGALAAPLHGGALLAMGVASAHAAPTDGFDDDGDGTVNDTHTMRGDGKPVHAAQDSDNAGSDTTAKAVPNADPAPPATAPRHPGYRWQSLIPGALK